MNLNKFAEYLIKEGVIDQSYIHSNGKPMSALLFAIKEAYDASKGVKESMKPAEFKKLISEEVKNVLMEYQSLEDIKLNAPLQKKLDLFVKEIEKTNNLTKLKVAAILNDVIDALGLNKVQITSYMNMLKQHKAKEAAADKKDKKLDIQDM